MKKIILVLSIILFSAPYVKAQNPDSVEISSYYRKPAQESNWDKFKRKVSIGGYGGATFGTVTNINLSPTIGYKITEKNIFGVGINYFYYADKRYVPTYTDNIYGGNIFDRQYITPEFFLQGEYQTLNYDSGLGYRSWNDYILAGGGYMPQRGFYIMALYILHQPTNSVYGSSPLVIRAGVMF